MYLRIVLSLALAATGVGVSVVPGVRIDGGASDSSTVVSTASGGSQKTPDVRVEELDLSVVPAADADPAPTPLATTTPSPSPSVPVPSPTPEVSADAGELVADALTPAGRVQSDVVDTSDFQTLGVTWPVGADVAPLAPQVRTRTDGTWSGWADLPIADDGPDAGTADAAQEVRAGTDSFWIGDADAAQLSFAATEAGGPDDMSLALIGSDATAPATKQTAGASASGGAVVRTAAYVTPAAGALRTAVAPAVITRGQWGAAPQVCAPDVAGSLVGAVVHHTAGSNSYSSVAEAMQQIRNDQSYHISSRGWCDIGYNFIVDKWGNIYEGRAGSLTQAVIGVHAGGFNTGTVGVAMLGTYDAAPPLATQDAVGRIIGWRLGAYGVDPQGSMSYYTGEGENSRFKNTWVTLPRVFGHRDVAYTACPGNGGYAALPGIRAVAASQSAAQNLGQAQALVKQLYRDILGRDVDPGGLQTWSIAIVQGMTPAQLGDALVRSAEYAFATVGRDYRAVLGREPDPYGLRDWTNAIISGSVRSEDLRLWLFSSVEFYQQSGGTDAGYVDALYRQVLGRGASAGELQIWVPVAAAYGSAAILGGVWGSWESATVRVNAFYQRYLGRGADPAGLQTWPPILLSYGEDSLRGHILGSLEYYLRAQSAFA